MTPSPAQRELANLKLHAQHLHVISKGSTQARNTLLRNATPQLVEALSSACRILATQGHTFPKAHARRAARLISRNTSKKTKMKLVAGEKGKQSRGGGFFKDVGKAFKKVAPALSMAAPMVAFVPGVGPVAAAAAGIAPGLIASTY